VELYVVQLFVPYEGPYETEYFQSKKKAKHRKKVREAEQDPDWGTIELLVVQTED
jgi:hypothetical protein